MAHFAQINSDNIVTWVIVVADEDTADGDGNEVDSIGEAFCTNLVGGTWRRTSYNNNYRVRYAGEGMTFDVDRDAFIDLSPFPSWVLNDDTTEWEAPTPRPGDGYSWDEDTTSWVEITE
jgi:hypothetical protein